MHRVVACASTGSGSAEAVVGPLEQRLGELAQTVTNMFPVWVVLAGGIALWQPAAFTWYVGWGCGCGCGCHTHSGGVAV